MPDTSLTLLATALLVYLPSIRVHHNAKPPTHLCKVGKIDIDSIKLRLDLLLRLDQRISILCELSQQGFSPWSVSPSARGRLVRIWQNKLLDLGELVFESGDGLGKLERLVFLYSYAYNTQSATHRFNSLNYSRKAESTSSLTASRNDSTSRMSSSLYAGLDEIPAFINIGSRPEGKKADV